MVDFNNENILATDKSSIMNIRIIEKDYYVCEAIFEYDKLKHSNTKPPTYVVKASIKALYNTCRANIKAITPDIDKEIKVLLESKELKDFYKAYELLGDWLYSVGVVKFVNKKSYNSQDPLDEAKAKGV